ncbi:MAG: ATP-binding protein [Phycicoccus sp.]
MDLPLRRGRHPLRLRLTLLYCLVSVTSSAVLLVIMWALARGLQEVAPPPLPTGPAPGPPSSGTADDSTLPAIGAVDQAGSDVLQPLVALAIMALLSLVLGWWIAGRVLRPVLTMTDRLLRISARNLHERLDLPGPSNELKVLADTIDGLLGRLEAALDAHRTFVANAAHEMRTPLTVERALLEESLMDPAASLASFRSGFEHLLVISEQRGALLESLLTLSGVEQVRLNYDVVDLVDLVECALAERIPEAERRGLRVSTSLQSASVAGDRVLLGRLLVNLCDNAIHHNLPGGRVEIAVQRLVDRTVLSVANTGDTIPPDRVDGLFEPFQRLHRTSDDGHHGLGLSIVRAIARAHGATLTARPRRGGGLVVDVGFPAAGTGADLTDRSYVVLPVPEGSGRRGDS